MQRVSSSPPVTHRLALLLAWGVLALAQSSALVAQASYEANCIALLNTSSIYVFVLWTTALGLLLVTSRVALLVGEDGETRAPGLSVARWALAGSLVAVVLGLVVAALLANGPGNLIEFALYALIAEPFALSAVLALLILLAPRLRGRSRVIVIGGFGVLLFVVVAVAATFVSLAHCSGLPIAERVESDLFIPGWIGVAGISALLVGLGLTWVGAVHRSPRVIIAISTVILLLGSVATVVSYVRGFR